MEGKAAGLTLDDHLTAGLKTADRVRMLYARRLDYASGYVCLQSPGRPKAPESNQQQTFYHRADQQTDNAALLPLDAFLRYFKTPEKLADQLEEEGNKLVDRWQRCNADARVADHRTPLDMIFLIHEHTWSGYHGQPERSEYELHFNTFGFTLRHQGAEFPPEMTISDVRVSISPSNSLVPTVGKPCFFFCRYSSSYDRRRARDPPSSAIITMDPWRRTDKATKPRFHISSVYSAPNVFNASAGMPRRSCERSHRRRLTVQTTPRV